MDWRGAKAGRADDCWLRGVDILESFDGRMFAASSGADPMAAVVHGMVQRYSEGRQKCFHSSFEAGTS